MQWFNLGDGLKAMRLSSAIGEQVMLIKAEVTGAPQNPQRPVKYFSFVATGLIPHPWCEIQRNLIIHNWSSFSYIF